MQKKLKRNMWTKEIVRVHLSERPVKDISLVSSQRVKKWMSAQVFI